MWRHHGITALVLGALLALPVLAWYQYRWIERAANSERARVELQCKSALNAFAGDFDSEIQRAAVPLRMIDTAPPASGRHLLSVEYRTTVPRLIEAVYYTPSSDSESKQLFVLRPQAAPPAPVPWPQAWRESRTRLFAAANHRRGAWHFVAAVPALVRVLDPAPRVGGSIGPPELPRGFLIIVLDSSYLRQDLLPTLTRRYFGSDAVWYHARVRSPNGRIIYDSAPRKPFSAASERTAMLRGINSDAASGAWQLAVTQDAAAQSPTERFRTTSLVMSGASFLMLAAAFVTLFLAMRRARALAQIQWEFVSGISHELRTPVAALRSIADNMRDGVVGPSRIPRYGKLITLQTERLAEMVEEVLEFGPPRRNEQPPACAPADIRQTIEDALSAHAPSFEEQGFEIARDIPANLPHARCSAATLRRCIQNLLANALKYGARGRWIRIAAYDDGLGQIAISIEDKGCGIGRDELKRIFQPFFRGRQAQASQIPGTGLGLSVVKRSMECIGGSVTVESQLGDRACFTLFLPIARPNETPHPDC